MASGAGRKAGANLRAGDAGDAEEELLVQQNTSAVYPRSSSSQTPSAAGLQLDCNLNRFLF